MMSHRDFLKWGGLFVVVYFVAMLMDGAWNGGTQFAAFNNVMSFNIFSTGVTIGKLYVPFINFDYLFSLQQLVTWNFALFSGVMAWLRFVLFAGTFAFLIGVLAIFGPFLMAAIGTLIQALKSPVVLAGTGIIALGGLLYSLIT